MYVYSIFAAAIGTRIGVRERTHACMQNLASKTCRDISDFRLPCRVKRDYFISKFYYFLLTRIRTFTNLEFLRSTFDFSSYIKFFYN